jgi:hypothetical protein
MKQVLSSRIRYDASATISDEAVRLGKDVQKLQKVRLFFLLRMSLFAHATSLARRTNS